MLKTRMHVMLVHGPVGSSEPSLIYCFQNRGKLYKGTRLQAEPSWKEPWYSHLGTIPDMELLNLRIQQRALACRREESRDQQKPGRTGLPRRGRAPWYKFHGKLSLCVYIYIYICVFLYTYTYMHICRGGFVYSPVDVCICVSYFGLHFMPLYLLVKAVYPFIMHSCREFRPMARAWLTSTTRWCPLSLQP